MDRDSSSTSRWEFIDFELEIHEGSPDEYSVEVHSPAGEAHERMRFPFDEGEIENRLQTLENALLRSGGSRRRMPSQEERSVQEFGQALFEALVVGEVRTRYEMSLDTARRQNKGLRLKLHIQPPELTGLPWEFLYDEGQGEYLSLSSQTPLVRYVDLHRPMEQLPVTPPLRILGMVVSPLDLEPLDVEDEKRLMEEAIEDLQAEGLVELTWLEGQTWRDLQRAMRRGSWHIFHFIGHGDFDPASDEGRIALANEAGRRHLLKATHLARLLDDHHPLRLAFLNSCEGAHGSEGDPFSSTAASLVRRGIPAVVAMQYEISDKAAVEFSRSFYEAVADGLPVDAAVVEARTAVSVSSSLEWGTPVLYMRSPEGRIFDISTEAPRPEPPQVVKVPDLTGQSPSQASSTLENSGLKLGDRHEAPSETMPQGKITVQSPEEGTEVEAGSSVTVTVSTGPMTEHPGGRSKPPPPPDSSSPPPPPSGSGRSRVVLWIGSGAVLALIVVAIVVYLQVGNVDNTETTELPNVVGKSRNEAEEILNSSAFNVKAHTQESSEEDEGKVLEQDPSGGEEAEENSAVAITVGEGPPEGEVGEGPPEGEIRQAVENYYEAVDKEDWNYTYDKLDSQTKEEFTRSEWVQKNRYFASVDPLERSTPEIVSKVSTSSPVEVRLTQTFKTGITSSRTTYFVWEDSSWKHRFSQEEYDLFMADASYEEFVKAKQAGL